MRLAVINTFVIDMIDLESKRNFLFDLDDTLINTRAATELGLKRAYEKLLSECTNDFHKLPSFEDFYRDLHQTYNSKDDSGNKKYFDYDAEVFDEYCTSYINSEQLKLRHYEHSLAARLFWHFRQTKNSSLMALTDAFNILNFIGKSNAIYCITQGKCNYQHTKAMLTDIEQNVDNVIVTENKIKDLKKFIELYGLDKRETLMVGDSENDIIAGKSTGVSTILIKSGKHDYDRFEVNADLSLNNMLELLNLLKHRNL